MLIRGPRSTWAEIDMGRDRWAEIDVGRDRRESFYNSAVRPKADMTFAVDLKQTVTNPATVNINSAMALAIKSCTF